MVNARILGTGSYLPEKILTNQELEKKVDTTADWIMQRVGIAERHVSNEKETVSYMGEMAGRNALEMAGVKAEEIQLIIVATTTPDKMFPSSASLLQHRLGVKPIPAFDVQAACAGFMYALSIADQYIRTGQIRYAMVVGAEVLSLAVDWSDRNTCVLFGDGAGAVVLGASEEQGILSTHLHADGQYNELLYAASTLPGHKEKAYPYIRMQGKEVFKVAVNTLESAATDVLTHHGLVTTDLDWLVPHQANIRIIQGIAKKLDLPMEKVVVTVDKHGNTSSASVPLALDTAVRDGRIQRGQLLLLEAFGGGFTWGSALVRF